MRKVIPLLFAALVVAAVIGGRVARTHLAVELSPQSLQAWVAHLGWWGPLSFLGLVTFRQFLLLPSMVLLPVGGLCFGALAGTGLGSAGILLSAVMKFGVARGAGGRWIRRHLADNHPAVERRIATAGPLLVGLATAHPMGPMAPSHWLAGLSSMTFASFLIAVAIASPIRAGAFSFLGSTLVAPGSPRFYLACAGLFVLALASLAHPAVRRLILPPGADTCRVTHGPAG